MNNSAAYYITKKINSLIGNLSLIKTLHGNAEGKNWTEKDISF